MRNRVAENSRTGNIHVVVINNNNDPEDEPNKAPQEKTSRNKPRCSKLIRPCYEGARIFLAVFLFTAAATIGYHEYGLGSQSLSDDAPESDLSTSVPPANVAPKCTDEQFSAISKQLNPAHLSCTETPWRQDCPITIKTKCYIPSWLTSYYSKPDISMDNFVAITLGCNAGYNSVDLLRMGTMDPSVDVSAWKIALGNTQLPTDGCGRQGGKHQITLPAGANPRRQGQVHCVEETQATAEAINKTSGELDYFSKGLRVYNQQITKTLDAFVEANVPANGSIDILEVENKNEFEVMGLAPKTIARTEYILYRFDWKENWAGEGRHTKLVTSKLNTKYGFTCYWAGLGKLWRITGCPFDGYDRKYWSHIACANRNLAPLLVEEMEKVFTSTIQE